MPTANNATVNINKTSVIGVFEGECADSNITNLNGLDITREVWENVFNSDDYQAAIKNGFYIGFLGHPEDPNCQDFEHACIVMTEGHIDDNGKVYGKFNLVDTPVGRIVKTFIDAGVTFGISVRGAGDIVDNSVDPETFIFRGFDLVTFPAYPESIPKFIAASSDADTQASYKKICAAVQANIDGLNTVEAIDIVQKQFAPQSDTYCMLQDRRNMLESANSSLDLQEADITDREKLLQARVNGLLSLYLDTKKKLSECLTKQTELEACSKDMMVEASTLRRKLKAVQRIHSDQVVASQQPIRALKADLNNVKTELFATQRREKTSQKIAASRKEEIRKLTSISNRSNQKISELQNQISENLKYKQIASNVTKQLSEKDKVIANLQSKLDETVAQTRELDSKLSNLDRANKQLQSRIASSTALISEYQDAYASLYSNAIGSVAPHDAISANTSVKDLQRILSSTSVASNLENSEVPADIADIGITDPSDLVTL